MKNLAKAIVLFATQISTLLMALLLTMSIFVHQVEGCFWYGLGLMVTGVALKLEIDHWFL